MLWKSFSLAFSNYSCPHSFNCTPSWSYLCCCSITLLKTFLLPDNSTFAFLIFLFSFSSKLWCLAFLELSNFLQIADTLALEVAQTLANILPNSRYQCCSLASHADFLWLVTSRNPAQFPDEDCVTWQAKEPLRRRLLMPSFSPFLTELITWWWRQPSERARVREKRSPKRLKACVPDMRGERVRYPTPPPKQKSVAGRTRSLMDGTTDS